MSKESGSFFGASNKNISPGEKHKLVQKALKEQAHVRHQEKKSDVKKKSFFERQTEISKKKLAKIEAIKSQRELKFVEDHTFTPVTQKSLSPQKEKRIIVD